MPELPEVETVARQLAPLMVGQQVLDVSIYDRKFEGLGLESMVNQRVCAVLRVGKQVAIEFGGAPSKLTALIHLRMSGRLIWHSAGVAPRTLPEVVVHSSPAGSKHTRLALTCNGGRVEFVDPRRFGTVTLHATKSSYPKIGVDPLLERFTPEVLASLLGGSPQPLKTWLLRQDRLVGLGNIYASEILFRAKLSPFRAAGSLSPREVGRLHREIRSTLGEAIAMCGTTFSDFQQSNGESGGFQNFLKVYEREGAPCTNCRRPIIRVVQAGRSSYYCSKCQS